MFNNTDEMFEWTPADVLLLVHQRIDATRAVLSDVKCDKAIRSWQLMMVRWNDFVDSEMGMYSLVFRLSQTFLIVYLAHRLFRQVRKQNRVSQLHSNVRFQCKTVLRGDAVMHSLNDESTRTAFWFHYFLGFACAGLSLILICLVLAVNPLLKSRLFALVPSSIPFLQSFGERVPNLLHESKQSSIGSVFNKMLEMNALKMISGILVCICIVLAGVMKCSSGIIDTCARRALRHRSE